MQVNKIDKSSINKIIRNIKTFRIYVKHKKIKTN